MTKRIASAELNQDNWKEEDVPEEKGLFQKASHSQLKMRPMIRARRRALATDGAENNSVFKSFKAFSSKTSEISPPVFSFLSDDSSKPKLTTTTPFTSLNFSNKSTTEGKETTSNNQPDNIKFSFGASADKEMDSSKQPDNLKFSFGSSVDKATNSNKPLDNLKFSFGAKADKETTSSKQPDNLKFNFGANADKATISTKQSDNLKFNFGANADKATISTKQSDNLKFNFGANADKATISTKQPDNFKFSFGAVTDKATNSSKQPDNLKFSFGASADKESNKSQSSSSDDSDIKDLVNTNSSDSSKNATDCVTSNTSTSSSASTFKFSFSTKEKDSEKSQPMFKFGVNSQDKTSEPSINSSFKFGLSKERNSLSKTTSMPPFKFGMSSDQGESSNPALTSPSLTTIRSENINTTSSVNVTSKLGDNSSHNMKENFAHNGPERNTISSSKEPTSNKFLMKLKALNYGVLKWVNQHVEKNPYINLKPIFDDYDKHFQEIKKKCSSSSGAESQAEASLTSLEAKLNHKQTHDFTGKSTATSKSTPIFTFGSSTSESKVEPFSFGTPKSSTSSTSEVPSLKTGKDNKVKPFTFGVNASSSTTSHKLDSSESASKASTNLTSLVEGDKPASFSFGSSEKKSTFSFGSPDNCANKNSTESVSKDSTNPIFSFGGENKSGSFSFSSTEKKATFSFGNSEKKPFTFGSPDNSANKNSSLAFGDPKSNKLLGFTFQPPSTTGSFSTMADEKKDVCIEECPPSDEVPQVEVTQVKEDDAAYEKKVKLFYKKEGAYVDKGVGTLYLKLVDNKTQLLIRALTTVGTILLNIFLSESLPTQRIGKNNVLIVCIPNPPLDSNSTSSAPVSMLLKVKTESDADELLEKINEYKK